MARIGSLGCSEGVLVGMPSQVLYAHPIVSGSIHRVVAETGAEYLVYVFSILEEVNHSEQVYHVLLVIRLRYYNIVHRAMFSDPRTEEEWVTIITETIDLLDHRVEVNPVDPEETTVEPTVVKEPYTGPRSTRYEKILSELPGSPEDILDLMGLSL